MSHKEDRSQVVRSLHLTRVSLCVHMKTISAAICGMRFSICARRRAEQSLSLWCVRTCMLRRMYFNGVSSGFQGRYSDFARIRNVKGAANMPSDFVHMHCVDFTHTHTYIHTRAHTGRRAAKTAAASRSAFHPLCAWIAAAAPLWNAVMCALNPLCAQGICCLCVSAFHSRSISNDLQPTLRAKLIF